MLLKVIRIRLQLVGIGRGDGTIRKKAEVFFEKVEFLYISPPFGQFVFRKHVKTKAHAKRLVRLQTL